MAKTARPNVRRELPRAPVRKVPGRGALPRVTDPAVREIFRLLQDRVSAQDQQLQELNTFALKAGSPVNAFNQRIVNVAQPVARDDAVPLWYLMKIVNEETLVAERRAIAAAGDAAGGNLNGSGDPTVPPPNLLDEVQAYAAAHPAELANSCLAQGGNWVYFDGLVAHLRTIPVHGERIGYLGQRGNAEDAAEDAVTYWHGPLPPIDAAQNVYAFDVISKHCPGPGESAGAAWGQVATAGALWLAVRP